MEIDFDGRVALVTGAGGGLGRTYALELARRGAKVVVNDLGGAVDGSGGAATAAEKVVQEIVHAGGEAIANSDSVSTSEGGEAMVKAAVDAYGHLDVCINNAGILRDVSFMKMDDAQQDAVIDVHLRGAFFVSRPAFKAMAENGYGRFLFTTSAAGLFGNFGQANYAAAKLGLVGLSNTLAIEGAKKGIQSNVIAPVASTRMTQELLGPMNELLAAEKITPMSVYLVSEACGLTHEIFSVAGNKFSRVFVGLGSGWFAGKDATVTPEDIAANLEQIRSVDSYTTPQNVLEEIGALAETLQK